MRAGQNPAKFVQQVEHAERVTVAILTHIPYRHGYYEQALEVFTTSLISLREHTGVPHEVLVFDNGSGAETVDTLNRFRQEGLIDFLYLSSRNLGKGKAWDLIFNAVPGEIVAYADSDVYYESGWLEAGLELLDGFPKAGMVTCRPLRTPPALYSSSKVWAETQPGVKLEVGSFIPWEVFFEHDSGLGQDEGEIRTRYDQTEDVRVTFGGHTALLGAGHWQFIARKDVLAGFTPLDIERPLGDDRKLDQRMNEHGYLRLMTTAPLVRHMGNVLPEQALEHAGTPAPYPAQRRKTFFQRLLQLRPVHFVLMAVYNRIFRWYFHD